MSKEEIVSGMLSKLNDEEKQIIILLVKENKEYKEDLSDVFDKVIRILRALGLVNPNEYDMKAEIKTGETKAMKLITKKLGGVMMDAVIAPAKLEEEFSFLKDIGPLLEKNAARARKQ